MTLRGHLVARLGAELVNVANQGVDSRRGSRTAGMDNGLELGAGLVEFGVHGLALGLVGRQLTEAASVGDSALVGLFGDSIAGCVFVTGSNLACVSDRLGLAVKN